MTARQAKKRGWEGPYRYHTGGAHSCNVYGWVTKRGTKWIHFWSNTDERTIRIAVSRESDLVEVK